MSSPQRRSTPGIWYAYVAYCLFMACIYLAIIAFGVSYLVADPSDHPDLSPEEVVRVGMVIVGFGLVFLIPFAIAPFLPRNKGAWIYGAVLIGLGLTAACTLPFAIPLFIFWLKNETKVHFGYDEFVPEPPPRDEWEGPWV